MLYDKRWDNKLGHNRAALVLLDAADYIDKHGWVQKTLMDIDGRVCLIGAINWVSTFEDGVLAHKLLERYLGCNTVRWNDRFCRSKQQAIDALIGAAGAP